MSGEWIDPGRDHWGFEYELPGDPDEEKEIKNEIAPDNTEIMAQMTDENDDLVEIKSDQWTEDKYTETVELPETKEEWTKTPGGFCKIDIDLEDEVREDLIDFWARVNLEEASLETYEDLRKSGTQQEALYAAVLNDIIIESLVAQIERADAEAEAANDTTEDV